MKASIIIPTRNRGWILKHCLKHLLEQTVKDYEIIVIDDASEDNTQKIITNSKLQIPNLKHIRLEQRVGCWVARNIGIKAAAGEIIIFVDSDVLVDKNFIKDHLEFHNKNDKIAVQGVVRHISKPGKFGIKTLRIDGTCSTGLVIQNCSVRKEWLMKAGLFREYKFMGYLDVELGMRLKKVGIKTGYAFKKCIAYHIDGYYTEEKLKSLFAKAEERGRTSLFFIQQAQGKSSEGLANLKVRFVSNILQTAEWAEKPAMFNLLIRSIDSPIIFLFPILKETLKYHYRAKGIKEGRNEG